MKGDNITITGTGIIADPYIINYTTDTGSPVADYSAGAQANSCGNINSTANGIYCIDPDGTRPVSPYLTYCDMNTDGGVGRELFVQLAIIINLVNTHTPILMFLPLPPLVL